MCQRKKKWNAYNYYLKPISWEYGTKMMSKWGIRKSESMESRWPQSGEPDNLREWNQNDLSVGIPENLRVLNQNDYRVGNKTIWECGVKMISEWRNRQFESV